MAKTRNKSTHVNDAATGGPTIIPNISSLRLQIIIAGLWLSLFMSALDTTIITTGLIKISSDFNALGEAAWLITTYLLTYNSFLMITAKLSDIWGLKAILLSCNLFFFVFSMACGGSQSMIQLIVFRAFQGIGGSGMYSLVFVSIMKLIVPEKMGFYSGVISSVFALANLLGPILGGIITDRTSWRWIFWINGPIVATSSALIFFSMPGLSDGKSNRDRIRSFDIVGGVLSISWPIPLLFALQEGGAVYEWKSGVIIGTLITGLALFFLFGFYETWISYKTAREAIFPIKFLTNPAMALLLLSMFLLGMPFYAAVVQLPQRFQSVNFTTAERAGILLLPVTLLSPVGAMFAGGVIGKKAPPEATLIFGSAVVCIGIGLLSSLSVDAHFSNVTYAYQIITGFGQGLSSPPYFMLLYTSIDEKDVSVGTGALNMARTLGGCVAIAICSALHHSVLRSKLPAFLTSEQIALVEETSAYAAKMPAETRKDLGEVFGDSYNKQFQVMLGFACLNLLVTIVLALVRKRQGIFGHMPVRKLENEFMKAAEEKKDEEEGNVDEEEAMEEENEAQADVVLTIDASKEIREEPADEISAVRSSQEVGSEAKQSRFKELEIG
ncbi:MFS general substrate transporter [Melanomma pulvis-pyrius CBS 109.77]|uniref:MFS general substrate transporter n=1 Tax=Melanomma pulvis-pyrius CBS 109.77 TaxID=1314802 RepID=A0A6A6X8S3_9PLEO|nr:MFS general substrate transporter [Melanomma pulvis-pyrius CBS 109.77]